MRAVKGDRRGLKVVSVRLQLGSEREWREGGSWREGGRGHPPSERDLREDGSGGNSEILFSDKSRV